MKIEQFFIGNTIKFRLRDPISEREAKEKLLEAAQDYMKTSNKPCCVSEVYPHGKSFGIDVRQF